MEPQLGISHIEAIPTATFDAFVEEMSPSGVAIEIRTHGGVYAGIELLLPTAIMLFVGRAYLDGFFSKAGEEHYELFRKAVKRLYHRADGFRFGRIGTQGKVSGNQTYSRGFSIMAGIADKLTFKLLLQPNLSEAQAEIALSAFFGLIGTIIDGSVTEETLERLSAGCIVGRTLLLAYDFEHGTIVPVDPLPKAGPPLA